MALGKAEALSSILSNKNETFSMKLTVKTKQKIILSYESYYSK